MNSPYFSGGGVPSFMPPPGLMQSLIERDKQMQEDAKSIGKMAGSFTAGIGGAIGGASNPGVFGGDTSATSGAMQGFMHNFNAGMNGGGASGFAGMVGGGGQGGGGGPMNFKQLAALGKTSDGLRETIRSMTPTVEGQDVKILGMTDEEWKHAGTYDKVNALGMYQQQQQMQAAEQGRRLGMLQYEQIARQVNADREFGLAMNRAQGRIGNETLAHGNGPVQPRPVGFADFAAAASPEAWQSTRNVGNLVDMARLAQANERSPNSLGFQEDPVSGLRFATWGNSVLPSGMNPNKASEVVELTAPDGTKLGYGIRNRTGTQPVKTGAITAQDQFEALQAEKRALINAKGRSVKTDYPVYDAGIAQIDEQLKALQGGKPAAAAAPAAPQPLPKSKDELKVGTVYETSRGPAKWDGEKFVTQ